MIFLIWNIFVFIIFCFRDRTPRTPLLKSKHRVMLITVLIFFQKKNPIDVNRDQERGAGSSMFETDFCFGSSRVEILVFVKKTKILPLWNNLYDTGNVTPALWLQEFLIFERPLFLKSIFFFSKKTDFKNDSFGMQNITLYDFWKFEKVVGQFHMTFLLIYCS